uniref:Variant surface glycoprotein 2.1 n=1 Tax=Trypanosoma brucei gambiense TaxID=31285 RepID=M4NBP8_TRYBG|nr:variant surface glycoprotein 2.1 [Trypanosoma brucei gambiense]
MPRRTSNKKDTKDKRHGLFQWRQHGAIAVLMTALLTITQTEAAAPNRGDNSATFSLLCSALNLATGTLKQPDLPAEAPDIEALAALLNVTTETPEALRELDTEEPPETTINKETTKANKVCRDKQKDICLKAAAKYKKLKEHTEYKVIAEAASAPGTKQAIATITQQILATAESLSKLRSEATTTGAQKLLNKARGPDADGSSKVTPTAGTNNRKTACGNALNSAAKGLIAGESLAADLLCICGKDAQQTQAQACEPANLAAANIDWNTMNNAPAQWATLLKACQKLSRTKVTTASAIRAAVTQIIAKAGEGQGTNKALHNLLGAAQGTGSAGCDGESSGSNGGACVYYGSTNGHPTNIGWAETMLEAADELDKAAQAAEKAHQQADQLNSLNKTLTAIALIAAASNSKTNDKAVAATQPQSITKCEAITKAEECRKKEPLCEWQGGEAKEGKNCTLKAITGKDNAAAGTGEGAGDKKDEKCKGKGEKDCKDGCKWDGKECKDSSILVNKQFALTVVSAAFAALLF